MWLTNDPEMAKKLRAIDAQLTKAQAAAKALPLAQKVEALRRAKQAHTDAMEAFAQSFEEG